ncbi:hypothetical protein MUU48_12860 [Scandinavium sp. H11S7]|uniref:hypothetical protein n=1 Tax=Scandinavium hiltneri TaxID=2926519 RepID=UPI002165B92F|nr:hypothetical protein [Scandinavium hiltneri]MCS2157799.1 hypothetical protein [Scandinavium hiltneri]
MKYIITATVIALISASALADTSMELRKADADLRSSIERVLTIRGSKQAFLESYQVAAKLQGKVTADIVKVIDNSIAVSCEEVGATITTNANQATKSTDSRVMDSAMKDLNDKLGDWAMYECFDLKGE